MACEWLRAIAISFGSRLTGGRPLAWRYWETARAAAAGSTVAGAGRPAPLMISSGLENSETQAESGSAVATAMVRTRSA